MTEMRLTPVGGLIALAKKFAELLIGIPADESP